MGYECCSALHECLATESAMKMDGDKPVGVSGLIFFTMASIKVIASPYRHHIELLYKLISFELRFFRNSKLVYLIGVILAN